MMIFWRRRLALLSVPKTGTHAYQAAYGGAADIIFRHPQSLKHMGLRRFNARIRPLLDAERDEVETMALIREPLDWLGSWYRYRARPEIRDRPSSTAGITFDEFVRNYLSDKPPLHARVGGQSGHLLEADGSRVTHLFAYEAAAEIGAFLASRLRVKQAELPQLNVSPKMDLPLSEGLREQLEVKLASDYALYRGAAGAKV